MRSKPFLCLAVGLSMFATGLSMAAPSPNAPGPSARDARLSLAPQERGRLASAFVMKWGEYVQSVYGIPVKVWASRMVPTFVNADPVNFRKSLSRQTLEGALATLNGAGARISDQQVIDTLASASPRRGRAQPTPVMRKLGDLGGDLVYTPIQPCRIVDTRLTPAGPVAANTTRDFRATATADFSSQGGSATDCGTMSINATAIAMNVTAVFPNGAGYATVYPFGSTQPLASSVNYTAGSIVNNAIISKIPNPLSTSDFTLFSFAGADYVVDVVGYFAPPQATALECATVTANTQVSAGANFTLNAPACGTGFTLTGVGCKSNGFREVDWATNGLIAGANGADGQCKGTNVGTNQTVVQIVGQCCRVPGR